jgi:hypothetical protein
MTGGEGQWQEVPEAPEGLDVGGLGATPLEHKGRWYVRNPHTGKAHVFVGATVPTAISNPLAVSTKTPTTSPLAPLGAALTELGVQIADYGSSQAQPPPAYATMVAACQKITAAYNTLLASMPAAGQTQGASAPAPSSAGMSKGATAALVGTGTAILGFAGGMAVGRLTGHEKPALTK